MGGKEKVPRPARTTISGAEANKKRVAKAAGVREGTRDQTKRAKIDRAAALQEKKARFEYAIKAILDEGHRKVNGGGRPRRCVRYCGRCAVR